MPEQYKILFEATMRSFLRMAQSDSSLTPKEFDAVAEVVTRSLAVLPDMEERDG